MPGTWLGPRDETLNIRDRYGLALEKLPGEVQQEREILISKAHIYWIIAGIKQVLCK